MLDDKDALPEAKRLNLQTLATFTILERAAEEGLLDLPQVIDEMRKTSFRLPPEEVIEAMLERDRQKKEAKE